MTWYLWLVIVALSVCTVSCLYHFYRIVSLGNPPEYARKAGHIGKAVRYSFTGAMSPRNKESAYLHMPTYTAGIIYHLGTFLSIALFFAFLLRLFIPGWISPVLAILSGLSAISGIAILVKRISIYQLRSLSNPDDYISNILVTAFQAATSFALFYGGPGISYFIITALLLFYFPLGKLKHAVYFFAARYHLGYFYGWRGVWPPRSMRK